MIVKIIRNCLSVHGKIHRRGEEVEVDDKSGARLIQNPDFVEVQPSGAKSTVKRKAKGKEPEDTDLPAPDIEGAVVK
ncbi:hypothetical protein [uncultured Dialister sp.]|uniref:hypothetical protein n=1 Tax=uncultured Dialister sp. TaxID=278064 RepID=UPI0027DB28E8|nr:hypothetical protein [uncultured Dialister sp.]